MEPVSSAIDMPFRHVMREAGMCIHQVAELWKVTLAVFVFVAVARMGLGAFGSSLLLWIGFGGGGDDGMTLSQPFVVLLSEGIEVAGC